MLGVSTLSPEEVGTIDEIVRMLDGGRIGIGHT